MSYNMTYNTNFLIVSHLSHSVLPQEATSASLSVDEKVREELEARRQRAKVEFLLGRDRSGEKETFKTEPEPGM